MTKVFTLTVTCLVLAACAQLQTLKPEQQSDWDRTLYYARRDVDDQNYFAADKLLDEFVRTHPDTRQAREIAFWKAAYMIDPANDQGSLSRGIAALDAYLAADSTAWYREEATLLRRTAAVAAGLATQSRPAAAPADSTPVAATKDTVIIVKSRDEQIAALREQLAKSKEELAKVSAELERIKKRLANPSS
jgi:hypothetical protein